MASGYEACDVMDGRKGCDCGRKAEVAIAFFVAALDVGVDEEAGEKGLARLDESDAKGEMDDAPGGCCSPFMPRDARGGPQRAAVARWLAWAQVVESRSVRRAREMVVRWGGGSGR